MGGEGGEGVRLWSHALNFAKNAKFRMAHPTGEGDY